MRFVLMVDGLLGADQSAPAPRGGTAFVIAWIVGFALAAVGARAIG